MSQRRESEYLAWLGLGGNIGEVRTAMVAALDRLDARPDTRVEAASSLYRTPPWGLADQPDFLNACAAVRTRLSPEKLLDACLETERMLKRVRKERWGPRTIDIDLLAMDRVKRADARLTLPHPRMLDRPFVLLPLCELAPDLMISGRSVCDWLSELDVAGIECVFEGSGWWRPAPNQRDDA